MSERTIRNQHGSDCRGGCGKYIPAGTEVLWEKGKGIRHLPDCETFNANAEREQREAEARVTRAHDERAAELIRFDGVLPSETESEAWASLAPQRDEAEFVHEYRRENAAALREEADRRLGYENANWVSMDYLVESSQQQARVAHLKQLIALYDGLLADAKLERQLANAEHSNYPSAWKRQAHADHALVNGKVFTREDDIEAAEGAVIEAEERIAAGDHSEAAYDRRDEAKKWHHKATHENFLPTREEVNTAEAMEALGNLDDLSQGDIDEISDATGVHL